MELVKFKVRPLGDRVIIKPLKTEEVATRGGIILPDTAKERTIEGKVVSVSRGLLVENGTYAPLSIKVGDIVLYDKMNGIELKVDGQEYTLMQEGNIYGVMESNVVYE